MSYPNSFQVRVLEYHPNEEKFGDFEGIPYGLFIGETLTEQLPDTLSVLVSYENRKFNKGEIVTFMQERNSENKLPERKLYAQIRKNHRILWVYGTEYPAIWCKIVE
ncbi:hypothetical protein EAX61_05250 [Dokdonia sinensis]|uniref:Uncharacterized protein n=2 Tax=Dokdonia sinensis TaxID=2479847 RepID=A0A3M0GE26_9FLAO|nr:hypothetical protein EAX61_05250 [Dokdonia sinensis]